MRCLNIGNSKIKFPGEDVYVIAEIGQNHQGCLETAKKMILEAKKAGCDCVKFQKSNLNEKFTKTALSRIYDGENSWGSTYGEHKEYLEFSEGNYLELQKFCKENFIDFTASAMDEISLNMLYNMNVPFIKIGSGDTNNFPLIEKASKLPIPLIISTGMQEMSTLEIVENILRNASKTNFAFLHCVSSYPTAPENTHLLMIPKLLEKFPNTIIGYSGHELGIEISQTAVLLGARIIERHFTLDKTQKGSDHKCSLEPNEFKELVDNIRNMKEKGQLNNQSWEIAEILEYFKNNAAVVSAFNTPGTKKILPCEILCKLKLGKSIVAAKKLKNGETLQRDHLKVKVSEPNGLPAEKLYSIIGKQVLGDIEEDYPIMVTNILS